MNPSGLLAPEPLPGVWHPEMFPGGPFGECPALRKMESKRRHRIDLHVFRAGTTSVNGVKYIHPHQLCALACKMLK